MRRNGAGEEVGKYDLGNSISWTGNIIEHCNNERCVISMEPAATSGPMADVLLPGLACRRAVAEI